MADLEPRHLMQAASKCNRVESAVVDSMTIPFPKWKLCSCETSSYKVEEEKENNFVTSNSNYVVSTVDRLYIPFSKIQLCFLEVDEKSTELQCRMTYLSRIRKNIKLRKIFLNML